MITQTWHTFHVKVHTYLRHNNPNEKKVIPAYQVMVYDNPYTHKTVGVRKYPHGIAPVADVGLHEQVQVGERIACRHASSVHRREGGAVVTVHPIEPIVQPCSSTHTVLQC